MSINFGASDGVDAAAAPHPPGGSAPAPPGDDSDFPEERRIQLVPDGDGAGSFVRKKRYLGDPTAPYSPNIHSSGGTGKGGFSVFCETTGSNAVETVRLHGTHGHSAAEVIIKYNKLQNGPSPEDAIPTANQKCNNKGPIGFNTDSEARYKDDPRIIREHPHERLRAKMKDDPAKGVWFSALRVGDNGILNRNKKGATPTPELAYLNEGGIAPAGGSVGGSAPAPPGELGPAGGAGAEPPMEDPQDVELREALDLFDWTSSPGGAGAEPPGGAGAEPPTAVPPTAVPPADRPELDPDGLNSQGSPPHESTTTDDDLRHGLYDLEFRRFLLQDAVIEK